MTKVQKWLFSISRILVGIVFIYSGFVKGVDPLGSTYKFIDYFNAFSASWANDASFILSILQSIAEVLIGVGLLLNLKIKQSSWGAFLFMALFTPLTLVLAISNPVHDCGCFGDALILTNWQTFWKNVILFIPTIYVFTLRKKASSKLGCYEQWSALAVALLFVLGIIYYSYKHLPILDFRPYKIGTHIPEKMTVPDDAPVDEWESMFIYEKNGEQKEFDLNNLPDSTWKFIDAQHVLINKGYVPPIHDFSIMSPDGDDITDLILASNNYSFLLVSYNLEKYDYKNQEKIESLINFCQENGYNFYGLTASPDQDVADFMESCNAYFEFYNVDEITLKTIVRSNPGIVLLKSGTVIDKWHCNDIPNLENLKIDIVSTSITKYKKKADNYYILLLIVSSALMISLYLQLRKLFCKNCK